MTRETAGAGRADIYTRITDQILADLEQGVLPWHKPWNAEHAAGRISRPLRFNGAPYQGINVIILWQTSEACGYAAPIWMTLKQANQLGGAVRKGERASPVVYTGRISKTGTDPDTGEQTEQGIPFLKSYSVFNVDQIDGLPDAFYARAQAPQMSEQQRIDAVEEFFAHARIDIRYAGNQAYYAIGEDRITMPFFETFIDAESFYATLAHESAHWTRHPSRLKRDFGRKRWGDEGYAMEELVAEITSAYLCADLGLSPLADPRDEHAAYIGSWIKVLQNDKRAIFSAAAHAQRAATFLHDLQPAEPMLQAAE